MMSGRIMMSDLIFRCCYHLLKIKTWIRYVDK